jgi:putative serine/threonine protein kinase
LKATQIHDEKESSDNLFVPLRRLTSAEHGVLLCYPGLELESFNDRLSQLYNLGVSNLILEGSSKVGKFGVIGKGCVSIVVKARLDSHPDPVALKIRRADANRPDMVKDCEIQKFANSFGVGPKAYGVTKDFFAMEYIDSIKIGKWFESIRTRTPKKYLKGIVRNMLEQCFLLDTNHLDHGELSNPSKHILIRNGSEEPRTVIIDYESASRERKPSNLTAVAAFLFLGSWQSERLRGILGSKKEGEQLSKRKLIALFGEYKQGPSRDGLESIEEYLRI